MRSIRNSEDSDERQVEQWPDSTGDQRDSGLDGILSELIEMVHQAKSVPLSSSVILSKEDLLDRLELARTRLPQELKSAQWMLRERQEFLDRVQLEAAEILDSARASAERMVAKTEIVRQANMTASQLLQRSKEEASKLRLEAQDYADQRLASLEVALEKTLRTVRSGRNRLIPPFLGADSETDMSRSQVDLGVQVGGLDAFFDQDNSSDRRDSDD